MVVYGHYGRLVFFMLPAANNVGFLVIYSYIYDQLSYLKYEKIYEGYYGILPRYFFQSKFHWPHLPFQQEYSSIVATTNHTFT